MEYWNSGKIQDQVASIEQSVEKFLAEKKPAQVDIDEVKKIKGMNDYFLKASSLSISLTHTISLYTGLIRETEATAAARYCGVKPDHIHCLHLPFYETGKVKKSPLGQVDIELVKGLLDRIKPHQIYCAGDLSDPHGIVFPLKLHHFLTSKSLYWCQRRYAQGVLECYFCSIGTIKRSWVVQGMRSVALQRSMAGMGAWIDWYGCSHVTTREAQKAFRHIQASVPERPRSIPWIWLPWVYSINISDIYIYNIEERVKCWFRFSSFFIAGEFWQRAEARNRATADLYDKLGLPEYEAIEGFVLFNGKTLNF